MKKNGCLFLMFFLFFTSSYYGQTKQDSINAYEKVNKWAVVKLTIAYMEDLRNWTLNTKKTKVEKEYEKEFVDYQYIKNNYSLYIEDVNLDKFEKLLVNNWSDTKSNIFQKYKNTLIDRVPIACNFENIDFVPEKSETKRRSEAIKDIKIKYSSFLPKQEKEIEHLEVVTFNSSERTNNANEIEKGSSSLNIMLTIFSILLVVVLFFYLKNKPKKKNIKTKNDFPDYYKSENEGLKITIEDLKKENNQLRLKIDSLERNNSNLIKKDNLEIDAKEKYVADKIGVPISLLMTKEGEIATETKLIYLPSPFEDNRFASEDVSETQVPFSLYVAEIDKNTNQGTISLIETADLSRALNSPNTFLEPVCNYENAYSSSAKEIKVIAEGDLVLEGNDWVVKTKIRIKFI